MTEGASARGRKKSLLHLYVVKYRTLFIAAVAIIIAGACIGFLAVKKLGGWRYTAHRLHTLEAWPTYTQRMSQLELLPVDSGEVVFLGDSHIAFGEWHEWLPDGPVANRGIPGEGIKGLQAFAKTLDLSQASSIILQIGTNDLLFQEAEVVIAYYKDLVRELDELGVEVFYCTLPGVNNEVRWTGIGAEEVELLNAFIRSLSEEDKRVVDLATALGTEKGVLPKGLTDDGVHLRGEGYSKWSSVINRNLNRVVRY